MTVQQFIDKLQALPEDIKQLPVYESSTFCGELDGEEEVNYSSNLTGWIYDAIYDEDFDGNPELRYPKRFHIGA